MKQWAYSRRGGKVASPNRQDRQPPKKNGAAQAVEVEFFNAGRTRAGKHRVKTMEVEPTSSSKRPKTGSPTRIQAGLAPHFPESDTSTHLLWSAGDLEMLPVSEPDSKTTGKVGPNILVLLATLD